MFIIYTYIVLIKIVFLTSRLFVVYAAADLLSLSNFLLLCSAVCVLLSVVFLLCSCCFLCCTIYVPSMYRYSFISEVERAAILSLGKK